jgi:peptide deformylase
MSLTIVTQPNPILRTPAKEVGVAEIQTPEFQSFADELAAFMISSSGVGLAANQVGISKRIISVLEDADHVNVYANPEIIKMSSSTIESEEGCLSVPGVYGIVDRAKRIRVRALDRHGRRVEFNVSGYVATIFQHEIDHLNGILFIDKVKLITKEP